MGNNRAVGTAGNVVKDPQDGVCRSPQAVGFPVFLSHATDVNKASQNGKNIGEMGKNKNIYKDKSGGVKTDQPLGKGLVFTLKVVVDNCLYCTDSAGSCPVPGAGQGVTYGGKGIC